MGHYFTNDPALKHEIREVKIIIKSQTYLFTTDAGVFSKSGLDFGTRTLLEALPLDKISGRVLDFGCGYGPIGIFVKNNTSAIVDMIDINNRSLELAKKNASLNDLDVNIFHSDTYQNVKEKYDYIITNPPIRVGKIKLYEILFDAKKYLKKSGELWLVINKNQGAKSLLRDLDKHYTVSIVEKSKGFYIIRAINN